MNGRILIGTCSWTDRTLIECGRFYPPTAVSAEERLRFYASQFPIVEVDSTYYGLPSQRNAALWARRTPQDFLFDIKAFSLFTHHPTPPSALPRELREALPPSLQEKERLYYRDLPPAVREELWRLFLDALLPLESAGKLGAVLFQFPPWFQPGPRSRDYILEAQERLAGYRLAVEFRAAAWLAPGQEARTLAFLREHRIPFVCVDEPQGLPNSVPPIAAVTADLALVRFHGRNRQAWAKKGATVQERFNYLYSEEELGEWVPAIRSLAQEAREVHVLYNNCYQDFAVRNARQMARLLQG